MEKTEKSGNLSKFLKLFTSSFTLSACTFGGGFVIIPLMKKKFVDELHYIDEEEMLDLTAIAQSSPGAIAVNAATLVGYRVGGLAGAIVSLTATVLPPLIIISVISSFYQAFRDNIYVSYAMSGMLAGVAAVITDVVLRMGTDLVRSRKAVPVIMMLLSFIAVRYFHINIIMVILICGCIGALQIWTSSRAEKERGF
jgi:chromate transporter